MALSTGKLISPFSFTCSSSYTFLSSLPLIMLNTDCRGIALLLIFFFSSVFLLCSSGDLLETMLFAQQVIYASESSAMFASFKILYC